MKHFKKGLLGVMVVAAMTLMAAEDRTIHVNTFEDEDNVNIEISLKFITITYFNTQFVFIS